MVLEDAHRLHLLNSESFEPFFSLLEEEQALFHIKVCSYASCILFWLEGDTAGSEQLCHPQHFAPAFLWLCISWLGFICSGLLLGGSLAVAILTPKEPLPPKIYLTSLMLLLVVTPIMGFILPFQSPLLCHVSAVVSLDSDCHALANFFFLVMAPHYQCCAWSLSALHATDLQAK